MKYPLLKALSLVAVMASCNALATTPPPPVKGSDLPTANALSGSEYLFGLQGTTVKISAAQFATWLQADLGAVFAPASHTHSIANVTGLQAALDGKQGVLTAGTDYVAPTGSGAGLTNLTKSQVGLADVDNTSDASKNSAAVTLTNKTIDSANNNLIVYEGNLSTSDVTSGNASTLKHGLLPKLDNNNAHYLDGSGAWSTPAGGGGGGSGAWVAKTADYTASPGDMLIADTRAGSFTVTLPSSPALGSYVWIAEPSPNTWVNNALSLDGNGANVFGTPTLTLNNVGYGQLLMLQYTTDGWEGNALVTALYVAANSQAPLPGSSTAHGLLKGDGAGNITAATAGTDYQSPLPGSSTANGLLKGDGAGNITAVTVSGLLKGDGTAAMAGTDYQAALPGSSTVSGLVKADGGGNFSAATAGTDYQAPLAGLSTVSGLVKGDGAGNFTNAIQGVDYAATMSQVLTFSGIAAVPDGVYPISSSMGGSVTIQSGLITAWTPAP